MVDYKFYLNKDYFKIGNFGEKRVQYVNIALAIIISIFLFSFLFYFFMYTSTNYHSLGDLEKYMEQNGASLNSQFDNINIGLKIMPSYNTKDNVLYMEHSNNFYKSKIPNSLSLMETYDMKTTFFFVNNTKSFFPTLNFKKESVPIGDSMTMCISASMSSIERGNRYELMKPIEGFEKCQQVESGKITWNSDDPQYGVDIPVWKQNSYDVDCTDEEDCDNYCKSYNAEYVKGIKGKKCYSYEILDYICLVIDYDPILDQYTYSGGCLEDNQYYLMVPAERNQIYRFESIEIEIRNKKDPIIYAGAISNYTFSFGTTFSILAKLLNFLLIISVIALLIIAYKIWEWKKKGHSAALLSDKVDKNAEDPDVAGSQVNI